LVEANKALKTYGPDPHVLAARDNAEATQGIQGLTSDRAASSALSKEIGQTGPHVKRERAQAPSTAPRTGVARMITWLLALLIVAAYVWSKSRDGRSSTATAMRAEDQPEAAPAPSLLPRGYEPLGLIAQGGMGAVNKARHRALNRIVAIKRMHPELKNNQRELARFIKEARLVAELKHPNIVEIFDIGQDAEGVFLVFEHLEGRTLHERIGDGRLDRQEALGVLKQIALAVEHAHAQRIVHRDLKPANIMLTARGVKVMDFGIARSTLDPLSTQSRVEVVGTPVYMAPEQEYTGTVGPAADVYALAGCAYEMLSGRPPFTYGGMMKAERRYMPLSQAADLPAAVDAVMDRALDPNPAGRWQGAREFYSALEGALV
ncbi:MAG: serine/threonine-protein kinase, partial [Elusimicrobiota bacterium]|nr:serine/threonine-protein kinase [Elusimicrobiota bacterium]